MGGVAANQGVTRVASHHQKLEEAGTGPRRLQRGHGPARSPIPGLEPPLLGRNKQLQFYAV